MPEQKLESTIYVLPGVRAGSGGKAKVCPGPNQNLCIKSLTLIFHLFTCKLWLQIAGRECVILREIDFLLNIYR